MVVTDPGGVIGDGGTGTLPRGSEHERDALERDDHEREPAQLAAATPATTPASTGLTGRALRRALVALDLIALVTGTTIAFTFGHVPPPAKLPFHAVGLIAAVVGVGYWAIRSRSLYLARVASVRSVELERLLRASVTTGLVWAALELGTTDDLATRRVVVGTALTFALLVLLRGGFRSWLVARRAGGELTRPVIIIGANEHAKYLLDLVGQHPELGFFAVGVVGDHHAAHENGLGDRWLGDESTAEILLREGKITGALIAAGAMPPSTLGPLVRSFSGLGGHVHLSPGVVGVGQQRLLPVHLSYEPLYYVEPTVLQRHQLVIKRGIDIVLALVTIVLTAPLLLFGALWIKAYDRGPVLFRQERVGRNGTRFTILKLRTMRVTAEAEMDALRDQNERVGPLFKMDDDPRVTRPGRTLRALSFDELPQLFNVLRGDMSLVGPRPALPCETETFCERMRERTTVPPGITGLWQVEARDNPSFGAYERLDLFYVENWSVSLDLCILLNTVESEVARFLRRALQRRSAVAQAESAAEPRLGLEAGVSAGR